MYQGLQSFPLFQEAFLCATSKELNWLKTLEVFGEAKRAIGSKRNRPRERQSERAGGRLQRGRTAFCNIISSSSLPPLERNQEIHNLIRNWKLLRKKKWKFLCFPKGTVNA